MILQQDVRSGEGSAGRTRASAIGGHPAQRGRAPRAARRAFSLVELLVVVSIISLLATLLTPLIASLHSQARQAKCAGNLRQVGMAFFQYRNEQEALPKVEPPDTYSYPHLAANIGHPNMPRMLTDYAGGDPRIFYCPANSKSRTPQSHWPSTAINSYTMTYQVMPWINPAAAFITMPAYTRLDSKMKLLTDMVGSADAARTALTLYNHGDNGTIRGMNEFFGDGHVVWRPPSGVWSCWAYTSGSGTYWHLLDWTIDA